MASKLKNRRRTQAGTFGTARNFSRLQTTFAVATPALALQLNPPVGWAYYDGQWMQWSAATGSYIPNPAGPVELRVAASDAIPFTAAGVFNKVLQLCGIAALAGAVGAYLNSPGLGIACMIAAFGVGLWGCFDLRRAYITAPLFALLEGAVLGFISRLYYEQSHGAVPLAVIGTTAIFFGVLAAYRTGLVRVGNKFIRTTIIAGWGLLAMMFAVILGVNFGLGKGGATLIIFGVLYLVIAVMDLFVDFEFVNRAQRAALSADGEWFAAFTIMLSVVMIYLALLRILGGRR